MTATTANIRGRFNTAAGGQLAATSDTSPVFRFRTDVENGSSASIRFPQQRRMVAIMLTGTWAGTITLQFSVPDMGVWADYPNGSFTANTFKTLELPGSADFRWIFTSRTSGTANAWIVP